MTIAELCTALEKELNKKLNELMKQAHIFKEVYDSGTTGVTLDEHILKLKDIYRELEPADVIIRAQNPNLCDFFDTIKSLRPSVKSQRKKKNGTKTDT